jgi:hypothetical protein
MFSHYFPGDGVGPEPPAAPEYTYPQWQAAVIMGMGLVPFPPLPNQFWKRVKLVWRLMKLIFSPDFDRALLTVKEVAVTPNMNNGKAWGAIGQYFGKQPGVGENVYRHLLACQKWGPEPHLGRHKRDTLLTLAWLMTKKERS